MYFFKVMYKFSHFKYELLVIIILLLFRPGFFLPFILLILSFSKCFCVTNSDSTSF